MNIERLNHQIVILEGVAAANKAFDLAHWGGRADSETTVGEIGPCGTACCAFGYAALDPTFQAQGLKLKVWDGGDGERIVIESVDHLNKLKPDSTLPAFENLCGLDAAMRFFDLSYEQVCWLFTPEEYLSYEEWMEDEDTPRPVAPAEVIERIRHLLAGGSCETHDDRRDREWDENQGGGPATKTDAPEQFSIR